MTVLTPATGPNSPGYAANRAAMLERIAEHEAARARVLAHSERARPRIEARGRLMPRDRLARLLDPGTPFVELSPLAGLGMHDDDGQDSAAGGGCIAGLGHVSGVRVAVFAHDSAIKGGAITPAGLKKLLRLHEIVEANRLPIVTLAESAGANLRYQSEMFVEGGRIFANQCRLSAAGLPQVTVVHGSSTAGGAYLPGLSDHVIAVRDHAAIYLAGPPLLKAATGEIAGHAELGGAEMHAEVSGLVDYLAEDDADGIRLAREVVADLGWDPAAATAPPRPPRPPRHDPDGLCGVIPPDTRQPWDMHEALARLLDDSRFLPFKPDFGPLLLCGTGHMGGWPLGIVANNGPIHAEAAQKAAQFIQSCAQVGRPILYLMNTPGYMVGVEAERAGIIKHGSKMLQAIANAGVPQFTIVAGGGFGAGYYGMCGRCFDPRFVFAWPNARVSVMGGEQAGRVLRTIGEEAAERRGETPDHPRLQALEQRTAAQIEAESTALFATARLWDDGIIDPRDTRMCLGLGLSAALNAPIEPPNFGVFRM